jgi:Fic family protein
VEYYEHLQKIRDEGDWESWLKFFLRGVYEVAQEATTTARNIVLLKERHRDVITENISSAANAYRLLDYLYERPIITVKGAAKVTGLSYANANNLISDFTKNGILHHMDTFKRNRRFIYSDYFTMFNNQIPRNVHEVSLEEVEDRTEFEG